MKCPEAVIEFFLTLLLAMAGLVEVEIHIAFKVCWFSNSSPIIMTKKINSIKLKMTTVMAVMYCVYPGAVCVSHVMLLKKD